MTDTEGDLSPGTPDACGSEFPAAGTLQEQVDHLVLAQLLDNSTFIHTFFNSYRRCADTLQVLDLLFTRFRTLEAPMGSSGQTDILPNSSEDVIPRNKLYKAISCLLSTWLDYHPQDFLAPSQHACLQRLRAHLRLYMCGSDLERRVSHIIAQLGIREPSQTEAAAPAAAPLADVIPSWDLDSRPPGNACPSPVGGAPAGAQAEATSTCKMACRPAGAKPSCQEEGPCAGPALLPSPEGARAASAQVPPAPTLALAPCAKGAALPSAELEPSWPLAPEPTGAGEPVPGGEMEPCSSFPPPLLSSQEEEADAIAEEEPVDPLAVLPGLEQAAFCAKLQWLLSLALLLCAVGAPAGLLSLLGALTLLLCARTALGSCVQPEPHSSRASGGGAAGAAAWSAEREPGASWAPGLSPRRLAIGAGLLVFLMPALLLLLLGGPTAVLSLLGLLTLLLRAVRALGSWATSVPSASVAAEHGAQGASDWGTDKKLASTGAPVPDPRGPASSADLEVFVTVSIFFYLLGAPWVVLFLVVAPTVGLCVVRATAPVAPAQASASLRVMLSADGAAASRAATEPPVSSAPPLTSGETASDEQPHVILPLAAMLSLAQTPALALCVGAALFGVLYLWRAPASKSTSWSAAMEPGSTRALELRPGDTAECRDDGESSCSLPPVLLLQDSRASPAEMEISRLSAVLLQAEEAAVSTAAVETPHTLALPLSAQGTLAPGTEPEPPANVALMPREERAAASLPHLQASSTLAVVMDKAPSASGESEPKDTSLPAQEACHPPSATRQGGRSQELPPALAALPHRVSKQLTAMDVALLEKAEPNNCRGCIWSQRHKKGNENLAPTIRAIVTQFNNVASCVITTCLGDHSMEAPDRARRVEFWIEVAAGCRILRNFSSLHAIISALQSAAIFRLHNTWRLVSRISLVTFHKLEAITSHENNYSKSRDLLVKETCKFTTKEKRLKGSPKWLQTMVQTKGVVPYLGIFLTDLIMLHSAYEDGHDERTRMMKLLKVSGS
ncbi:uncharacterized protein RHO17_007175 [Thomomys bottae]